MLREQAGSDLTRDHFRAGAFDDVREIKKSRLKPRKR